MDLNPGRLARAVKLFTPVPLCRRFQSVRAGVQVEGREGWPGEVKDTEMVKERLFENKFHLSHIFPLRY